MEVIKETRQYYPYLTTRIDNILCFTGLDPWDLGGMNDALSPMKSGIVTNEPPKSKSPASFLGEHANLVNMDELVSRPPANSK